MLSQQAQQATVGRHLVIPDVKFKEESWGPCFVPPELTEIPYQPFSKSDRIGHAADFISGLYQQGQQQGQQQYPYGSSSGGGQSQQKSRAFGASEAAASSAFFFKH